MRYYLDHAATSWPKYPGVVEAATRYLSECGAAAGRGGYQSALQADGIVQSTRRLLADSINAQSASEIAFCSNGTQALNAAIMGIALHALERENSPVHFITTATEHNSVLRPLELAASRGWIEWSLTPCDADGAVDVRNAEQLVAPNTRWVIVNHASNVTGTLQDISDWSAFAKRHQLNLLVDAAQSLGYVPIDVQSQGIDCLCSPGHKGLGGVLGTGFVYLRQSLQSQLAPLWIGGTGNQSDQLLGDFGWTEILESGNLNVAAIASLNASMEWKKKAPCIDFSPWLEEIFSALQSSRHLRLVGLECTDAERRLPVISIAPKLSDSASCRAGICQEWSLLLDSALGVECRAGFHCAGAIHSYLGTDSSGGTLRLSLGVTTTPADVAAALEGIRLIDSLY